MSDPTRQISAMAPYAKQQSSADTGIPAPAQLLTAAGLLPLALMVVRLTITVNELVQVKVLTSTVVYGALILSLAGGTGWGLAMRNSGFRPHLFAMAVPLAVGWLALIPGPLAGLAVLACGFILQGWCHFVIAQSGALPAWFGRLCLILSAVFSAGLLFVLVWLIQARP